MSKRRRARTTAATTTTATPPTAETEKPLQRRCIWFEPVSDDDLFFWRRFGITDTETLIPRHESVFCAIARYLAGGEADRLFWLEIVAAMLAEALEYVELAQRGARMAAGPNVPTMDELAAQAILYVKRQAFEQAERLLTSDWMRWTNLRGLWARHIPSLPPDDLKTLTQTWREIAEAARARRLTLESRAKAERPAPPKRRGRLSKALRERLRIALMALLLKDPELQDEPGRLASELGVCPKTAKRLVREMKQQCKEAAAHRRAAALGDEPE